MALYLIGLGLCVEKDISLKGLEAVKNCSVVYLEHYTSILQVGKEKLETLYGKSVVLAAREFVEDGKEILKQSVNEDVALLVVGDPMAATTHVDLFLEARKKGILVQVIHNASVFNAVGVTGLQLYKFGKTTSIPFDLGRLVEAPYNVIKENLSLGLHSLVLLDLDCATGRFMTVNEGLQILLDIEKKKKEKIVTEKTLAVGVARLGSSEMVIRHGTVAELLAVDFGTAPHCIIISGKLHFMEEEALLVWK